MILLLAATSFVIILIVGTLVLAPRKEVITKIEIDATPAQVWSLLGDPGTYRDWNPFIISVEGELAEGATLTNRLGLQAGREMTFRPTVLRVIPERELRWIGRLFMPRLFDGEHYFILEKHKGGTRLVHGERFRGILLWYIDTQQFHAEFERMNAALKARVETEAKRS